MSVVAIRRAEFQVQGRALVTVEVSDGKVEIYGAAGSDGIESWVGYVSDPSIPAPVRMGAIEALVGAPYFRSWTERYGYHTRGGLAVFGGGARRHQPHG